MAQRPETEQVTVERRGDSSGPVALLLPGQNFPVTMPLLHYTSQTLQVRGWTVDEVRWQAPADDIKGWALRETTRLLDRSQPDLVVGKSLSSLALPATARRGVAGVWLTPLLHLPELTSIRLDARHLLVGGTADRSWEPAVAAASDAKVMEIPDGDHLLALGDIPTSIRVLADIQQRIAAFIDALHA